MKSPFKNERKLITDFYMWMVENDYDHNIRIRVENKAELFLRGITEANGVGQNESTCNLQNVSNSLKAIELTHDEAKHVNAIIRAKEGADGEIVGYLLEVLLKIEQQYPDIKS